MPPDESIDHPGALKSAATASARASARTPDLRRAPLLGVTLLACCAQPRVPAAQVSSGAPRATGAALVERARESFAPLGAAPREDARQVALGRTLFFETRVSADARTGCVTCHLPQRWGTDGLARSRGAFGRESPRNSPSVFNAGAQASQHWRGDRDSLEDEARRALLGPAAYGLASNSDAVARLNALEGYAEAFARAFPGDVTPVSVENWGAAIAAYQRTLVTPAPLDDFLSGKPAALSPAAQAGLASFLDLGCARCHRGALLGGGSLEKFGVVRDYRTLTHSATDDNGRFDVTHVERDRDVFKVAPLRNVAHTAPYFHDGSVASLHEAVEVMAAAQLGKNPAPDVVADIVAFLEALGGAVPPTFAAPGAP
ncbi:cytochrome-c peroxidase [Sorangium sp. So ce1128]